MSNLNDLAETLISTAGGELTIIIYAFFLKANLFPLTDAVNILNTIMTLNGSIPEWPIYIVMFFLGAAITEALICGDVVFDERQNKLNRV